MCEGAQVRQPSRSRMMQEEECEMQRRTTEESRDAATRRQRRRCEARGVRISQCGEAGALEADVRDLKAATEARDAPRHSHHATYGGRADGHTRMGCGPARHPGRVCAGIPRALLNNKLIGREALLTDCALRLSLLRTCRLLLSFLGTGALPRAERSKAVGKRSQSETLLAGKSTKPHLARVLLLLGELRFPTRRESLR